MVISHLLPFPEALSGPFDALSVGKNSSLFISGANLDFERGPWK